MKRWFALLLGTVSSLTGCARSVDRDMNQLKTFSDKLACQYQLEVLHAGTGLIVESDKTHWAVNFVSRRKMTIEQVRPMVKRLATALFGEVRTNPAFAQAVQYHNQNSCKTWTVGSEGVGFKLTFWDEIFDRPLYPYIAQVRLVENKLFYYYADPKTQALQEPIQESLTGS